MLEIYALRFVGFCVFVEIHRALGSYGRLERELWPNLMPAVNGLTVEISRVNLKPGEF